jgi:peptide chain release factor 1
VNRDKAMQQLKIRLYELQKNAADAERAEARSAQVGSGDRSEKIRTYNYPENRVTDHRIGLTLYSLDKIIAGDKVDEVIDALMSEDQARRLAAMED